MRLFFAVAVPGEVRQRLARIVQALPSASTGLAVRWVRPDQIHLTLHFLGEHSEREIPALERIGTEAAESASPFQVVCSSLGAFPSLSRPRIFWVGILPSSQLSSLASSLSVRLREGGFPGDERPFTPHLTLGRVKEKSSPRKSSQKSSRKAESLVEVIKKQEVGELIVPVREFLLIESRLAPEGASYQVVTTFSLTGK